MIKFTFKKPPRVSLYCYSIGFIIITVTMLHQFAQWQLLSVVINQQLFMLGAIIVAVGSLFNWLLPLWKEHVNNKQR